MHPVVEIMLFQALTVPLDQAEFPTGYAYHHDSTLEYAVEYRWQDARTLTATHRPVEGAERQAVLNLGEDSRLLRESSRLGDTLKVRAEYEYFDGKLRTVRFPGTVQTYHYLDERLDSIAETSGDTLEEYYKYAYDSQGRLIRTDHGFDRDGMALTMRRRRWIAYFLPDSIVITGVNSGEPEDSSRATLHLSGGRPMRMVEVEYSASGEESVSTHIWWYSGLAAIKVRRNRLPQLRFRSGNSGAFDLLGRSIESGPRKIPER